MAAASFMPEDELARRYSAVLELGREPVLPALVPDFPSLKTLCGFVSTLTRLLCYVLEFMPAGASVLAGTASGRHAGRLGICEYDFRFKKTIFLLYLILLCHAVPGNDGSILSGPGPFQDTGHTSGGYTAWNILHLS